MHVPGDVSIIGIDDHELAEFFGLTTIAQFPDMQGRMAVEVLMDELHPGERSEDELNIDLPYELVVRSSTARKG
jgi:DNA-binding LacI/PurR family transcriptional regulator